MQIVSSVSDHARSVETLRKAYKLMDSLTVCNNHTFVVLDDKNEVEHIRPVEQYRGFYNKVTKALPDLHHSFDIFMPLDVWELSKPCTWSILANLNKGTLWYDDSNHYYAVDIEDQVFVGINVDFMRAHNVQNNK